MTEVVLAALMAACGSAPAPSSPAPTAPTPVPNDVIQITGRERIGWNQEAASIAGLHFAMYIDTVTRVELREAACGIAADAIYNCESPLPPLTKGRHSLELATWVDAGGSPLESSRAAALTVEVTIGTFSTALAAEVGSGRISSPLPLPVPTGVYSGCGVATGLNSELVTWDTTGSIKVVDGQSGRPRELQWAASDDSKWTLTGLAVDSRIATTGWIYLAQLGAGLKPALRLVRYRKAGDVLGERAVLFQDTLAGRPARIRLWADLRDRLYVALLDSNAGTTPNAARPHQFLIRLTAEGRLPIENPAGSVFAPATAAHPIDLAWPGDGSDPVVVEQIDAHTYTAAPASLRATGQASSFSTTSVPISAQLARRDGEPLLWILLANGEVVSLEDSLVGWSRSGYRRPAVTGRPVYDAVFIAGDELAVCGPVTAAGTGEFPAYGIWRIRLRN